MWATAATRAAKGQETGGERQEQERTKDWEQREPGGENQSWTQATKVLGAEKERREESERTKVN